VQTKHLAKLEVGGQALGCMSLTGPGYYGSVVEEDVAEAAIVQAVELGVTLFDTANIYGALGRGMHVDASAKKWGPGVNEELVGRVLRPYRDKVQISTKFGIVTNIPSPATRYRGDRPYVRACVEGSLARLGTDYIDLLFCHRVDPLIPIEETVGAMAELVNEGKVRFLGLCEVTPETLERACSVHPISAIQHEWSLWCRDIEEDILTVARRLDVGIVPYAPLGRGFLTGKVRDGEQGGSRFTGENYRLNMQLVERVKAIAAAEGATAAQVALKWLDLRGDDVVPIPGADRPEYIRENVAALDLVLSSSDLEELDALGSAVAGSRYDDPLHYRGTTPPLAAVG
jgi:aryl-alcohol dehydrogenase-like predicted oxidoreductase